jgi:cell division protein FtsW
VRKSALYAFGLVVAALVALGFVILFSASETNGIKYGGDPYFFVKRQAIYLAIGIVLVVALSLFDYHKWREWAALPWMFYLAVIVMLALVFLFPKVNGSHRWIDLGPFRAQPSELAKVATVVLISAWMDRSAWKVELFKRGALFPAMIIAVPAALILAEPDFGSFMVLCAAGFLVMFVAGTKLAHLGIFITTGVVAGVLLLVNNSNRMARLFGGSETVQHQAKMALVAFKNGGLFGCGLGQSLQKEVYLPEAHTDFIFAIGAEELGLPCTIATILMFSLFFALAVYIARKASDRFGRFLVIGMAFLVFFQAMFNLGVVCKALPTKGMALPFFSYGGTNLMSSFIAVGTILSVGIHSWRDRNRRFTARVLAR